LQFNKTLIDQTTESFAVFSGVSKSNYCPLKDKLFTPNQYNKATSQLSHVLISTECFLQQAKAFYSVGDSSISELQPMHKSKTPLVLPFLFSQRQDCTATLFQQLLCIFCFSLQVFQMNTSKEEFWI